MARYRRTLGRVAVALEAPHAARVRILEELAADLDALHAELVAQGVPPAQARRRAEALLDPSAEVVADLGRVHRPIWSRLATRYGGGGAGLERVGLAVLTLGMLASGAIGVRGTVSLRDASPFLWPVLALIAGAVMIALLKAVQLYLGSEVDPGAVRRGLELLLLLPVVAFAVALLGSFLEFWRAARRLHVLPLAQAPQLLAWVQRSAVSLGAALLGMLFLGLAWLWLSARATRVTWTEMALRAGRRHRSREAS